MNYYLFSILLVNFLLLGYKIETFDNGVALTPPMGFLTWNRYRCIIDCENYPNDCVNQNLILKIASLMSQERYKEAGYQYVVIDDCWPEMERDTNGTIIGDKKRFPLGMKYVGDQIKKIGLKFGLYSNIGIRSCKGYPGIAGYVEQDLLTYVNYGVEYIKVDGCDLPMEQIPEAFINISNILLKKYPKVVYACAWPDVTKDVVKKENFTRIAKYCNVWRSYDSIEDSAQGFWHVYDYFRNNSAPYTEASRPGAWNDADMLIVGGYGVSLNVQKVQMAIWCILPSPLMISTDLNLISPYSKAILLNKLAISVNQDKLGKAGILVDALDKIDIWCRPLSDGVAVAVVSRREDYPVNIDLNLKQFGLETPTNKILFIFEKNEVQNVDRLKITVTPQGVMFLKMQQSNEAPFRKPCIDLRGIKRKINYA